MDRDLSLGNRAVANYMQQKQKKRLKQRLKYIRQTRSQYSSVGMIKQKPKANSIFFQKNQQIQKQNIALFNRIASIIKKTPKVQSESTSFIQKPRDTSILFHRKIQSSLEEQNKSTYLQNNVSVIQKRLMSQKPTINNKLFYQQRAKHIRYLKTMSKYPYILHKKVNTEPDGFNFSDQNISVAELPPLSKVKSEFQRHNDSSNSSVKELFKHQSLDFTISVSIDMKSDLCTFSITSNQSSVEKYALSIPKTEFIEYFEQSEYDYQKMIANLRLNDLGNIEYLKEDPSQQNKRIVTQPKEQVFKFKAQSTAYTSTGFKTGFRSNKRNLISKNQNQQRRENVKTDRKSKKYQLEENKAEVKQDFGALSENKFAQISLATNKK